MHLLFQQAAAAGHADGRALLAGGQDDRRTLATHPYEIGRGMLVLWNVVPLLIYFACWPAWPKSLGTTDWGRLFMFAGATFGTFLTTFAVSINNHVLAAAAAAVAL